jgi:ABC-type polysaccharide/polyol phosphate export permease
MTVRRVTARRGYGAGDILAALGDLNRSASRWRLWSAFAIEDMRTTYRRSLLGVAWVSLSFAVFVAVKVLIFGSMIGRADSAYYSSYLMLGFFTFQFMTAVVNGSTGVFTRAENWIKNDPIELPVFAFELVLRKAFDLALTGVVVIAGLFYFQLMPSLYWALIIPALALYFLNALWVSLFLGAVCARHRDMEHLISTIMRFMFFLTPIFWLPDQLPRQAMDILYWNPFAHFMWILRTPILDQSLALDSWIYVGVTTVVGWVLAVGALTAARRRLAFWF